MQIDVDSLMARIRAEVVRRRLGEPQAEGGRFENVAPYAVSARLSPLPLLHLPKPAFVPSERYRLNDFLALHDKDFIDAAYRGVLGRNPDGPGVQHFLGALRSGNLSKIEVLGRLRYSPEGRRRKISVTGLLPAFIVQQGCRLPLVGGVIAFAVALARLPRFARNLQGFEGYQHLRNAELEQAIRHLAEVADANERHIGIEVDRNAVVADDLKQRHDALQTDSETRFASLSSDVAASIDGIGHQLNLDKQRLEGAEQRLFASEARSDALRNEIAELVSGGELLGHRVAAAESRSQEINQHLLEVAATQQVSAQLAVTLRETLDVLEVRIDGLGSLIRRQGLFLSSLQRPVPAAPAGNAASFPASGATRFDRLYFEFEQRFRGSREEIRQRVSYYLPLLRDSVVGKEGAVVLDIGCGRGEWLELLGDEKISARGIDTNPEMAKECLDRGLEVAVDDAIAHLRRLPDNALGAVTAFHVIEHISLDALIELIEESRRVVQPGGLVIFETPNPENIVVGACNFYIDPTHQHPLPPVLTQFFVEAGGFIDVAIHRVNAELLMPAFEEPKNDDPPVLKAVAKYLRSQFFCAPDYSVVGRVP